VIALIVGKTIGITLCSLLAIQLGFALPAGVTISDIVAMSALGGVGLTVALFVANEAFVDPGLRGQAKMGAVISVLSAVVAGVIKWVAGVFQRCAVNVSDVDSVETFESEEFAEEEEDEEPVSPSGAGHVDEVLVDDILQIMWTIRKYRARGVAMPLEEQLLRAPSKMRQASERAPSKMRQGSKQTARMPSKQSYNGAYPAFVEKPKSPNDTPRKGSKGKVKSGSPTATPGRDPSKGIKKTVDAWGEIEYHV